MNIVKLHLFVDGQYRYQEVPDKDGFIEWVKTQQDTSDVIEPIAEGMKVYATPDGVYAFSPAVPHGASDVEHADFAIDKIADGSGGWKTPAVPAVVEKTLAQRIEEGISLDAAVVKEVLLDYKLLDQVESFAKTTGGRKFGIYFNTKTSFNTSHAHYQAGLAKLQLGAEKHEAMVAEVLKRMAED